MSQPGTVVLLSYCGRTELKTRLSTTRLSTGLGRGPDFISVQTAMERRRHDGTAAEVFLPVSPAPDQKSLIFPSQQLFQMCNSVHNCITRCMRQEAKANSSQHHPKAHQRSFTSRCSLLFRLGKHKSTHPVGLDHEVFHHLHWNKTFPQKML